MWILKIKLYDSDIYAYRPLYEHAEGIKNEIDATLKAKHIMDSDADIEEIVILQGICSIERGYTIYPLVEPK